MCRDAVWARSHLMSDGRLSKYELGKCCQWFRSWILQIGGLHYVWQVTYEPMHPNLLNSTTCQTSVASNSFYPGLGQDLDKIQTLIPLIPFSSLCDIALVDRFDIVTKKTPVSARHVASSLRKPKFKQVCLKLRISPKITVLLGTWGPGKMMVNRWILPNFRRNPVGW